MKDCSRYSDWEFWVTPNLRNKRDVVTVLTETIRDFFSLEAVVPVLDPHSVFNKKYNINIMDSTTLGGYRVDQDNALLLGRVFDGNRLLSAVGFHLQGVRVDMSIKLFNQFGKTLTHFLSRSWRNGFKGPGLEFGDELVKEFVARYLAQWEYNPKHIRHLIEYLFKLRTTSYEGRYFSTGLILTKSFHDFRSNVVQKRCGTVHELESKLILKNTSKINKRLWYLIDGKDSFLLGNKDLCFTKLFVIDRGYDEAEYLSKHRLTLSLRGVDVLFKIENEKLLSIAAPGNVEFLFFENRWKCINYNSLKGFLNEVCYNANLVDRIIYYALYCSTHQLSSILWFPSDLATIDDYIRPGTRNRFLKTPVNILTDMYSNHMLRCMSSDGVTIFNQQGDLLYLGAIVHSSRNDTSGGMQGTGETAASALRSNGISIKISQDGMITIFSETKKLILGG